MVYKGNWFSLLGSFLHFVGWSGCRLASFLEVSYSLSLLINWIPGFFVRAGAIGRECGSEPDARIRRLPVGCYKSHSFRSLDAFASNLWRAVPPIRGLNERKPC